ncbi:MAG: NADAR family protein [Patescibacteria group bacterium]
MYPDSSEGLNQETDDQILFFTPAFHVFDNFSAHIVTLWGHDFQTAEHAYQWKKFSQDLNISRLVLTARSPEAAHQIGKQNKDKIPQDWHDKKVDVMKVILRAKAEQNDDIQEVFRRSGDRAIVENNPIDDFWGNGPDNNGQNIIGNIWMEIREKYLKKT